jgi:LPS-assembly lipoprotein
MLLASCGFQLRGEPTFGLTSISVVAVQPSPVVTDIRRTLGQGPTRIMAKESEAAANLRILGESREKTVHTITGTGRVYEFQLRLAVRFEVLKPGRELPLVPPTEVETRRLITYSETAPTAKEAEEQLLFKDMQVELAGRILRQVAVAQRGET